VKSVLSLVILAAFCVSFCCSSCTTLSNRRDLYKPGKPDGPWTKRQHDVNEKLWHNKILDY
jgi:hypothetical protein